MTRRYNLRKRDNTVKWIEDETLKDKDTDSESEDEDYEPSESSTEEEIETEEEEEEEETESESEEEEPPQTITLPIPKRGVIKIEIDNRNYKDDEEDDLYYEDEEDEEDEEEEEDEFLDYLVNKYVPNSKLKKFKPKKEKESDEPALELNDEEQDYYDELSKSKQKKLNKQMKQLSTLVSNGDVPFKFRIIDLPISDMIKASVIKKLDIMNKMDMDGGESHKLRTWVEGFLRIPFEPLYRYRLNLMMVQNRVPSS